jgi:hypothetical protein
MTRGMKRLFCTLLLGSLGAACNESEPRVYTAQFFRPDPGCLESYAPLGLVQGESLSALCEPVCLALGEDLYVSTVCPPYPAEVSLELPSSEGCGAALEAVASELACDAADAGVE